MSSAAAPAANQHPDLVVIDYADVVADDDGEGGGGRGDKMADLLERAFGPGGDCLGLVAIRNIPGFVEAKESFLPMAHGLAHLDPSYLESHLTDAASTYNAGWSRGREKLRDDRPDLAKGSYYFNPTTDEPGTAADRERFPASYPCNVWPDESVLPGFRRAAIDIGRLMHAVVADLSRHIDAYAAASSSASTTAAGDGENGGSSPLSAGGGYPEDLLHTAMRTTQKVKGRLLYYYPLPAAGDGNSPITRGEDDWIGWHCDSGFLTALAGDMYVDDETGRPLAGCPDPGAGLHVMNKSGDVLKVDIPDDCMAVQLGECVQILTGGKLVATPHCVRGVGPEVEGGDKIARVSLPCFVDAGAEFPLRVFTAGRTRKDVLEGGVGTDRVPPLAGRWTRDGMAFGDFLQKTFATYYDWSKTGPDANGTGAVVNGGEDESTR